MIGNYIFILVWAKKKKKKKNGCPSSLGLLHWTDQIYLYLWMPGTGHAITFNTISLRNVCSWYFLTNCAVLILKHQQIMCFTIISVVVLNTNDNVSWNVCIKDLVPLVIPITVYCPLLPTPSVRTVSPVAGSNKVVIHVRKIPPASAESKGGKTAIIASESEQLTVCLWQLPAEVCSTAYCCCTAPCEEQH